MLRSKNNHRWSLIILLTATCSEWLNKWSRLILRDTELWVCGAYRALKCRTFCSLLFVEVMDGAHRYSGSPALSWTLWVLCYSANQHRSKQCRWMSRGLLLCVSCAKYYLLPIMSAVINCAWQCQGLSTPEIFFFFESFETFYCCQIHSLFTQHDKTDTVGGWMDCRREVWVSLSL